MPLCMLQIFDGKNFLAIQVHEKLLEFIDLQH